MSLPLILSSTGYKILTLPRRRGGGGGGGGGEGVYAEEGGGKRKTKRDTEGSCDRLQQQAVTYQAGQNTI